MWVKSKPPSCKRPREKQQNQEDSSTKKPKTSGNYQAHLNKMTEVELIVVDLEKRHGASEFYC